MVYTEMQDKAETAISRGNIYSFLKTVYREEVTIERLQQIKAPEFSETLSEQGIELEYDFLNMPEEKLIEDLAVEYARLFIGPGPHISPHESVHHSRDDGDWGQLWGADTVSVKKFIESGGLEYKSEYTGLPDHISVELEFMQEVTMREAQAWKEKDDDGAVYCLKMEKKFIDEHLAKWAPVFCDRVITESRMNFYKAIARLTKDFILHEGVFLEDSGMMICEEELKKEKNLS